MRDVIVLRDFEHMPEKGFTILPITHLLPRHYRAEPNRRTPGHPEEDLRLAIGDLRFACQVTHWPSSRHRRSQAATPSIATPAATPVTSRVRDGLVLRVVGLKKSAHVRNLAHGSGAR